MSDQFQIFSEMITEGIKSKSPALDIPYNSVENVRKICQFYGIKGFRINPTDLTVSVVGSVRLAYKNLKRIPIRFSTVTGNFNIQNNEIEWLVGCPKSVKGDFICKNNKIRSLGEGPTEVTGAYNCSNNKLTTLKGCPSKIGFDFDCSYNELKSLEHRPKFHGDFYCQNNEIESLEYGPKVVNGFFYCYSNMLTGLRGGPIYVASDFDCSDNRIISLDFCPKIIGRNFDCSGNPREFTKEDLDIAMRRNPFDFVNHPTVKIKTQRRGLLGDFWG